MRRRHLNLITLVLEVVVQRFQPTELIERLVPGTLTCSYSGKHLVTELDLRLLGIREYNATIGCRVKYILIEAGQDLGHNIQRSPRFTRSIHETLRMQSIANVEDGMIKQE